MERAATEGNPLTPDSPPRIKVVRLGRLPRGGKTASIASKRLDDALGHLLGVAEEHHGVVAIEQRVVDAGIARTPATA